MVKASIILLNYNGKKFLKNCLDSLLIQTYKDFEIIFIDNNSEDKSVSFVKKNYKDKRLRILARKTNDGFSGGNNAGYEISKGKFIILLNNDTIVEKNWLKELIEKAESDKKIGIVQSKILFPDKKINSVGGKFYFPFIAKDKGFLEEDKGQYEFDSEIEFACGCSLLIKREVLEKLGYLFDNKYFIYYEDVDLSLRTKKLGCKVVYAHKSILIHYGSATMKASPKAVFLSTRNKYFTLKRNKIFYLIPFVLFWDVLSIIQNIFKNKEKTKSKLKAIKSAFF